MPVVTADDENTNLIQIGVARIVRGNLVRGIDQATVLSWKTPETTPELIREASAKLIAAQLYYNKIAAQSSTVEENSRSQLLYNEGMAIINGILNGSLAIADMDVSLIDEGSMSTNNFWPIDDTDRAFTMGMQL